MHGASWTLIAVAFVLGMVLTSALMIRRVEREVPVGAVLADEPDTADTADKPDAAAEAEGAEDA
jgi:uncharacterized membrane protein ArfC